MKKNPSDCCTATEKRKRDVLQHILMLNWTLFYECVVMMLLPTGVIAANECHKAIVKKYELECGNNFQ